MSDVGEVAASFTHQTLECIVLEFDGDKERVKTLIPAFGKELRLRGAHFTQARHVIEADNGGHGLDNNLYLTIERDADGEEWHERIPAGGWLVVWLHDERVSLVEQMTGFKADALFRPIKPVIRLTQARRRLETLD